MNLVFFGLTRASENKIRRTNTHARVGVIRLPQDGAPNPCRGKGKESRPTDRPTDRGYGKKDHIFVGL